METSNLPPKILLQNQVLLEFFTTTNPQTEANFVQEWTEKTANRQSYLNFSRNYNTVGEEEEDKKQELLDQMKDSDSSLKWKKSKRLKGAAKLEAAKSEKNEKNPYLKKSGGNLTKITQNRLLLMGTPPIVYNGNKEENK